MNPFRIGAFTDAAAFLILLTSPLVGQELPAADELIDRYVAAIGGRDAHEEPTSIRTQGRISLPGMGLEGDFELLQLPSVGSRMRTSLPGIGEMLVGFDGEVGWSMNPVTGPAVMQGDELAQIRERSQVDAAMRSRAAIPERETLELTLVEGQECYRVRLGWASGRESFDCFSVETGLLVTTEEVQTSQMGEVPVVTYFSEYRDFHEMRLPTRLRQETMGMQQVMEILSVELNDAEPGALAPPPAIMTLLEDPVGGR